MSRKLSRQSVCFHSKTSRVQNSLSPKFFHPSILSKGYQNRRYEGKKMELGQKLYRLRYHNDLDIEELRLQVLRRVEIAQLVERLPRWQVTSLELALITVFHCLICRKIAETCYEFFLIYRQET